MGLNTETIGEMMRVYGELTARRLRAMEVFHAASYRLATSMLLSSRTKGNRLAKRAARRAYDDAWRAYSGVRP